MSFIRALLGRCDTRPLSRDYWGIEGPAVRVKLSQMPEPLKTGGAVYLEGRGLLAPILVLRAEDDRYLAFMNKCTHFGRRLDPVPGKPLVRCCSVNHSTFGYDGNKISGPAKAPLTRYEVEHSGGDILVKF